MGIAGGSLSRSYQYLRQLTQYVFSSLTIKLVILVGIFVAVPFVLYGQFEKADRQTRNLLIGSIRNRSWLVAQALTPVLDRAGGIANAGLNEELEKFAQDGTTLRLMFRPNGFGKDASFYFVASAPALSSQDVGPELDNLVRRGILKSLADSCSWKAPIEFRYGPEGAPQELLTSVVPIDSKSGCWVLVSTHNGSEFLSTAIGRPYWQTDGVRVAAVVYLVFAVLAGLIAMSVRRALRHFRSVARDIMRGGSAQPTFATRNIVPELSSVASDFDHLVRELRRTAADIRRTAEDNAHAVKTPLATIRSALEPLKRTVPSTDHRAVRATHIIESSLAKLTVLVSAAQRLGNDTADFLEAPKLNVNFTSLVFDVLQNCRDLASEKNVNIVHRLATDVYVLAPDGIIDVVVENILDNALSFSPTDGLITVTLSKDIHSIDLFIDDQGPGIDPDKVSYVFERYVSLRPPPTLGADGSITTDEPPHSGLGLWIVKRHIEALGGRVVAVNRSGGGLRVHISLPTST